MKTFQYQILRCLPDRVSGEFINLGVVVYLPEEGLLRMAFNTKTNRMHSFFPTINSKFIVKTTKEIESFLQKLKEDFSKPFFKEFPVALQDITKQVLPKDDSSLFFTDTAKILDLNIDSLLDGLYKRLVLTSAHEADNGTMADADVWKKLYKQYFDQYGLTDKLKPINVKTHLDSQAFEHSCKNGALHCFESVSFDLSNDENIKKKVYTWAGRIQELKTVDEELNLYLLTALPEKEGLKVFIKGMLNDVKIGNTTVQIVETSNAEGIIRGVKTKMEEHI